MQSYDQVLVNYSKTSNEYKSIMNITTRQIYSLGLIPQTYLNPKPNRWIYSDMKFVTEIIDEIDVKLK